MTTSSLMLTALVGFAAMSPALGAEADQAAAEEGFIDKTIRNIKSFFADSDVNSSHGKGLAAGAETDLAAAEVSIRKSFSISRPDLAIRRVGSSELPGLYEVEFANGPVVYSSVDGRFFIAGELYENTENGIENVAERKLMPHRAELLAAVKRDDMIIFSPKGETKGAIYVFTDVDCGYCQKLHREVPELNAKGIEVRYLAYPRAGLKSATFQKMVTAWCADDQQQAMNTLKSRGAVPLKTCEPNPIADQFRLGSEIGVTGTPAIITERGQLIPGYRPADQLVKLALTKP